VACQLQSKPQQARILRVLARATLVGLDYKFRKDRSIRALFWAPAQRWRAVPVMIVTPKMLFIDQQERPEAIQNSVIS